MRNERMTNQTEKLQKNKTNLWVKSQWIQFWKPHQKLIQDTQKSSVGILHSKHIKTLLKNQAIPVNFFFIVIISVIALRTTPST